MATIERKKEKRNDCRRRTFFDFHEGKKLQKHALHQTRLWKRPTPPKLDILHMQKIPLPKKVLPLFRTWGEVWGILHVLWMLKQGLLRIWRRSFWVAKEMGKICSLPYIVVASRAYIAWYWSVHALGADIIGIVQLNYGVLACKLRADVV